MIPHHCILYCFTDMENRPKDETSGNCLDYLDADGKWKSCAEAIATGRCCKKRTTPIGFNL